MKKLYVISKFDDNDIIKFNAVEIIEEKEHEFILLDKINNKNIFLKEDLDKEYEFLFVTKNRRKIRKQMKRIYENIQKKSKSEISVLEYKLNKLKSTQKRNEKNYEDNLEFLKIMKK